MHTATNQVPTQTCTTHPYDAHATPPCRCVRQWPSHAPQKLQDFEDCDYSVHAAEASVRHGSPACAYCSFPQQPMRPATAPEADLSAQGYLMGPKREPRMPERRCCCALAAQAFCARSSRWSRCSCSRPWPSVHFSCAPLLNTHTRAHARTHTHARATGRRATPCRTPPHAHRSWAHASVLGTRASVQNTPGHSHAHTPPNCAP